jgi:hypothetical protein
MRRNLFIGMAVLLVAAGCFFFPYDTDLVSRKYTPSKLQYDFSVFRSVLEKGHPGLYTYTGKAEMNHYFDSIYATLNTPTDIREFLRKLSFIVDKIGCSHTNLYLPKSYYDTILKRDNFFPIPIIYVDGGLYINSDMWDIPVGSHILSINGHQAGEIMKRLAWYNVPDGVNKDYSLSQAAVDFSFDYFLAYGPSAAFVIEYAEPHSPKVEKVRVTAVTLEKHQENYNYYAYYNYPQEVGYDFEIIDSIHTALLTLRSFSYSTAPTFTAYKNFLNNSFTLLHSEGYINNLVIDCRNNTGGEYENIFLLLRYLSREPFKEVDSATVKFDKIPFAQFLDPDYVLNEKPSLDSMIKHEFCRLPNGDNAMMDDENVLRRPLPMAFNGNVYVITNSNVLSAAANFVAMMKDSRRGIIVGEETGGGYNGHNGFSRILYQLPNTGIQLEFSAVHVKYYLQHPLLNKYGVQPDYYISNTLDDVINNQDPQLSFVTGKLIDEDN